LSAPFVEDFETAVLNNGWIVKNDVGNQWEISDTAFFSSSKALRLKNFSGNTAGSFDEIITPSYDLTSLPTGGTPFVRFKLAYAGKISSSDTVYDALKMYVSKDCGETWSEKYTESGATLGSATATSASFAPATTADWKEISRPLPGFLSANNVMFKFVFHSNGGNNVYIDDINVTTQISGCEEILMENLNFSVQPNPVAEVSQITFALTNAAQVNISVYDILGKEVKNLVSQKLPQGSHAFDLSKSALGGSGIYIVKASFEGNQLVKKIVVE